MDPLAWPASQGALREIAALGVNVTGTCSGASPYHVVGGRSAQRWWLLPVCPRAVSAKSYGLFQPVLWSARVLTQGAILASNLGLTRLLPDETVHLAGNNILANLFPEGTASCFAYFSGTPGPHRKTVVQIMAGDGHISGYAKVSCDPRVVNLLHHEAEMLDRVSRVGLRSASVPRVVYSGACAYSTALVTDSVKIGFVPAQRRIAGMHLNFLAELPVRCPLPRNLTGPEVVLGGLAERFASVSRMLTRDWRTRLHHALASVSEHGDLIGARGLSHGDFTPWNSFPSDDGLYVFDWEYADWDYPADYDLIHFLSTTQPFLRAPPSRFLALMRKALMMRFGRSRTEAGARLLAYFCAQTLRYACRVLPRDGDVIDWAGSTRSAEMLDTLLAEYSP